jgi:methyl-accepting chemotaxis protein
MEISMCYPHSSTQSELDNNTELHYFHHYNTIHDEVTLTFEDNTIRTLEYQDEWGTFRGIFIPIRIDDSHTIVLASEVELSYLNNIMNDIKQESYKNGFLFLIFIAPFIFSIRYILKRENFELQK